MYGPPHYGSPEHFLKYILPTVKRERERLSIQYSNVAYFLFSKSVIATQILSTNFLFLSLHTYIYIYIIRQSENTNNYCRHSLHNPFLLPAANIRTLTTNIEKNTREFQIPGSGFSTLSLKWWAWVHMA